MLYLYTFLVEFISSYELKNKQLKQFDALVYKSLNSIKYITNLIADIKILKV